MPHVFSLAKSNSSTVRNRRETTSTIPTDDHPTEGNDAEDQANQGEVETKTQKVYTEILWKIDWVFKDINQTLSDTCMSETRTLRELLDRFFNDTWRLGPTLHLFANTKISGTQDLSVFLITASKDEILMNIDVPIREALNGQAIIEYPVFHITMIA